MNEYGILGIYWDTYSFKLVSYMLYLFENKRSYILHIAPFSLYFIFI